MEVVISANAFGTASGQLKKIYIYKKTQKEEERKEKPSDIDRILPLMMKMMLFLLYYYAIIFYADCIFCFDRHILLCTTSPSNKIKSDCSPMLRYYYYYYYNLEVHEGIFQKLYIGGEELVVTTELKKLDG